MRFSIAKLVKALKLPVALYRIDGGYGVQPRWSNAIRKGTIKAGVCRVIEPEEAAGYTDEELYRQIKNELTVNEARDDGRRYVSDLRGGNTWNAWHTGARGAGCHLSGATATG